MKINIELQSVTADIVVLDYSTGSVDFIELPDILQGNGVQTEDIEEYLGDTLNYHMSDIYWMACSNSREISINYIKQHKYENIDC